MFVANRFDFGAVDQDDLIRECPVRSAHHMYFPARRAVYIRHWPTRLPLGTIAGAKPNTGPAINIMFTGFLEDE